MAKEIDFGPDINEVINAADAAGNSLARRAVYGEMRAGMPADVVANGTHFISENVGNANIAHQKGDSIVPNELPRNMAAALAQFKGHGVG